MLPKILKNFNVFVDGRGYAGKIDEITLPKLTIKTEEYRAEKATLKCTVAAHYYKLTIGGNELIEIDAENMIRKINGVDQMALLQAVLGIWYS